MAGGAVENEEERYLRRCQGAFSPRKLCPEQVRRFRRFVTTYYRLFGRALPWRTRYDPYEVFVSEIMLQQTQVSRVVPFYTRFLSRFPRWQALAEAPLGEVFRLWPGLGYNRRARALREAARIVNAQYGGMLPPEEEKLKALPGVGPATARAIQAYAFGKPVVFLETNIRSVFLQYFFPGGRVVPDAAVLPLVERTLDRRSPRLWYSALMDLGAAVKKYFGNPVRRSAHHRKQSPFEGSLRQARGRIVGVLCTCRSAAREELARRTKLERRRLAAALEALLAEGILTRQGRRFGIAE